jgi:hypothetical protein
MVTLLNPITTTTASVAAVPVSQSWSNVTYVVVYSVYVPSVAPNDVVMLNCQFEVTNSHSYVAGFGRYILRTNSATEAVNGTQVTQPVTAGISPQEHHGIIQLVGIDSAVPAGGYYYNVVSYATNENAGSGDGITVEPGYGTLTALVFNRP